MKKKIIFFSLLFCAAGILIIKRNLIYSAVTANVVQSQVGGVVQGNVHTSVQMPPVPVKLPPVNEFKFVKTISKLIQKLPNYKKGNPLPKLTSAHVPCHLAYDTDGMPAYFQSDPDFLYYKSMYPIPVGSVKNAFPVPAGSVNLTRGIVYSANSGLNMNVTIKDLCAHTPIILILTGSAQSRSIKTKAFYQHSISPEFSSFVQKITRAPIIVLDMDNGTVSNSILYKSISSFIGQTVLNACPTSLFYVEAFNGALKFGNKYSHNDMSILPNATFADIYSTNSYLNGLKDINDQTFKIWFNSEIQWIIDSYDSLQPYTPWGPLNPDTGEEDW